MACTGVLLLLIVHQKCKSELRFGLVDKAKENNQRDAHQADCRDGPTHTLTVAKNNLNPAGWLGSSWAGGIAVALGIGVRDGLKTVGDGVTGIAVGEASGG